MVVSPVASSPCRQAEDEAMESPLCSGGRDGRGAG